MIEKLKNLRYNLTKNVQIENLKNFFIRTPRSFFYALKENFPGKNSKLGIIGITGTKGKTSVSFILYHVLSSKFATSLISTIEAKIGGENVDTGFHVTSPDSNQIYKLLKKSLDAKTEKVVLEVTSHGIFQKRVSFIDFEVAVFTNIARDHLDYHPSFEHYLWSKSLLFRGKNLKLSVLNFDDELSFEYLKKHAKGKILTYSIKNENADIFGKILETNENGTRFLVKIKKDVLVSKSNHNQHGKSFDSLRMTLPNNESGMTNLEDESFEKEVSKSEEVEFFMPVLGEVYVSNALSAIAVGIFYNIPLEEISKSLKNFSGVPGRMEKIDEGQKFSVLVDFAHTPDSLQKLLESVQKIRKSPNQQIITVFGNAGERDPERRKMGGVSAKLSDITILTAEDPRSEGVEKIMAEAEKYAVENGAILGKNLFKIGDRRTAIKTAFEMAKDGDIVLLSGKGHEQSMNLGNGEEWWDDRVVAREELKKLLRK
ncbi:MAG: UDP-N-acetylmuramoyl-L-alanyl-D-glutamate--2,6-diaminopimelate ligase [Patescibacteria group bacterium]